MLPLRAADAIAPAPPGEAAMNGPAPAPEPAAGGDEAQTFSRIRGSLIKALRAAPASVGPICDALELLEALQQRVATPAAVVPAPPPNPVRPTGPAQEYVVQDTHEGPFLTERRPTGSQPFRCPRPTYDAIARLLAAHGPLHFDELLNRLNDALPERQADYRLRVCLRFWVHVRLIERFKTRYRAKDVVAFERAAGAAWDALPRV